MFEILFKIWFLVVILPILMIGEGYKMLKKFMLKHGYPLDWMYILLCLLLILLIVLLLLQYGYS